MTCCSNGCKGKGKAPPPPPPPPLQSGKGKGRSASEQQQKWPINASVQRALSGEEATFHIFSDTTITNLKERIERHWNVPALCQKMVTDTGIICQDEQRLQKYCPNGLSTIQLVMLVSVVDARMYSKSDEISHRFEASVAFSQLAAQHTPEALDILLDLVLDPDRSVRIRAARGLAHVARLGVERAIRSLGQCMGFAFQDDLNELTNVIETLAYLASEGNGVAWSVVLHCLDSPDKEVIRDAVLVLAVASFGYNDERSAALLRTCCEHADASMRADGISAIQAAASEGDKRAIDGLVGRLNDESVDVRNMAIAGLGSLAEVGDERVISILISMLKESEDSLNAVLIALSRITRRGNKEVLATVQKLVEDPKASRFALSTYATLASQGDEEVICTLLSKAHDVNREVRAVVVVAISKLARHDDERLIQFLTLASQDLDIEVRIAAVHALAFVATRGNREAFTVLHDFKQDSAHRDQWFANTFASMLHGMESGDTSASPALQHDFRKHWRWWSLDFTPEERAHVNDARRG